MANKIRRYLLGAGLMFATFLCYQVANLPADLASFIKHPTVIEQLLLGGATTILAGLVIWLLIYFYRYGLSHREDDYFAQQPTLKRKWLMAGVALIGLFILLMAQSLIREAPSENQHLINEMLKKTPWLTAYTAVIIAPIIEELIFRGLFYNYFFIKLGQRWVLVVGIIVNGLLFASIHTSLWSPSAWIYFFMGVLFASMYVKTRDLRFSIGLHMFNNALGMLPVLL